MPTNIGIRYAIIHTNDYVSDHEVRMAMIDSNGHYMLPMHVTTLHASTYELSFFNGSEVTSVMIL